MGVTFQPLSLEGPIKSSKCVDFRKVYFKGRNMQNCHMIILSGSDDVARS